MKKVWPIVFLNIIIVSFLSAGLQDIYKKGTIKLEPLEAFREFTISEMKNGNDPTPPEMIKKIEKIAFKEMFNANLPYYRDIYVDSEGNFKFNVDNRSKKLAFWGKNLIGFFELRNRGKNLSNGLKD